MTHHPLTPDLSVQDHGTVHAIHPLTPEGVAWLDENVEREPWQIMGDALLVNHRYSEAILEGAGADGLAVEVVLMYGPLGSRARARRLDRVSSNPGVDSPGRFNHPY